MTRFDGRTALVTGSSGLIGSEVVVERLKILGDIRRLLVAIIPRERGRTIRPRKPRKKQRNPLPRT